MKQQQKEALDSVERSHLAAYGEHVHAWHRQLLSLSSAGLTLLVALQQTYIPENPRDTWALQLCWVSLALCVLFSLLLLWGRAQSRLDGANILRKKRMESSDQAAIEMLHVTGGVYFKERTIFSVARYFQTATFLIGLCLLTWFAIVNVGQI
ncbi:MAG: hypothetical protein EPN55_02990 [Gammaproteobacteria bacterium]|nr:MAG: hypothetical protein EPN55_02990 [Gammaproteobacteria bacterium]